MTSFVVIWHLHGEKGSFMNSVFSTMFGTLDELDLPTFIKDQEKEFYNLENPDWPKKEKDHNEKIEKAIVHQVLYEDFR